MKYEEMMRYYQPGPGKLVKIEPKKQPVLPASSFWIFILMTMLLLFAIALLNRGL